MMHNVLGKKLNVAITILLFIFLVLIAHAIEGFRYDAECFGNWALNIYKNGLRNTYTIFNNYMPFYQYVLYFYSKLNGSEEAIVRNIHYLKAVTIFFDFVGLWFVYRWVDKKFDYAVILLVSMLNICFSYDSIIWGQVDGIYCAFVFISVYYAYTNKIIPSVIWFVIALNMKLQSIIFIPILGLIYLYQLADKKNYKSFLSAFGIAIITEACILFPFTLQKDQGIQLFLNQVTGSFSQYPWLGDNNFWSFIFPVDTWSISDAGIFVFGLTYKTCGLILFAGSALLVMMPLLKSVVMRLLGKKAALPSREILWLTCAFIAVFFYFFNTEMHERYSHPALLFLTAYAFFTRNFLAYTVYCLAYFLVLETGVKFLQLHNYGTMLFHSLFRASMFALAIICMGVAFLKTLKQNRESAVDQEAASHSEA